MNKEDLQNQIAKIMNDNPAPKVSKELRSVLNYEAYLREENVESLMSLFFYDLDPTLKDIVFNEQYNFTGMDYKLNWMKDENGVFSFFVENIKYNSKKKLIKCNDLMINSLYDKLENLIEIKLKENKG